VSKTFGRKIKLILCSDILKQFIEEMKFTDNDYIFSHLDPKNINEYLRNLGYKILKIGNKEKSKKWINEGLTMYDFRHCSCCYWVPRYKSESALKYRFGWKKSERIYYYSELLGMKDTIAEEDLLIDVTKTEIEKRLLRSEQDNRILKEKVESRAAIRCIAGVGRSHSKISH